MPGNLFCKQIIFFTNLNFTKMLNKILKITAAAAFMVALAVNIDMMINDPFVGMSTEAIATDTDSGTDGFSRGSIFLPVKKCYCCQESTNLEVLCDCTTTILTCEPGGPLPDCSEVYHYDYFNCATTGNTCNQSGTPCPTNI